MHNLSTLKLSLVFLISFLLGSNSYSQKLELEWSGSQEDLILLIQGGKIRFAIEGTSGGSETITFKIRSTIGDSLVDVMSLIEEGYLRAARGPVEPQDVATKEYVDKMILSFGISLGNIGIQGLLDQGFCPLEIIGAGAVKDSLYGLIYQGGLIFYMDDQDTIPGIKGMVAAPVDQATFTSWGCTPVNLPIPDVPFNGGNISGPGSEIGDGITNTAGIIAGLCSAPGDAANLCNDLVIDVYNDWFLPSLRELEAMYLTIGQGATNVGGFGALVYWSSTEINATSALTWNFSNGLPLFNNKASTSSVRAARAF